MSSYQTNPHTLQALVSRKVRPLGAAPGVVRASQRRAWAAVRAGHGGMAAIREAVSWAASRTDQPERNRPVGHP